jgi:hypothetical protein
MCNSKLRDHFLGLHGELPWKSTWPPLAIEKVEVGDDMRLRIRITLGRDPVNVLWLMGAFGNNDDYNPALRSFVADQADRPVSIARLVNLGNFTEVQDVLQFLQALELITETIELAMAKAVESALEHLPAWANASLQIA